MCVHVCFLYVPFILSFLFLEFQLHVRLPEVEVSGPLLIFFPLCYTQNGFHGYVFKFANVSFCIAFNMTSTPPHTHTHTL